MKIKKMNRLLWWFIVFCIVGCVGVAIGSYNYFTKDRGIPCQSLTLEFTYEGAADGLAPDGSKFYITDIYSKDILDAALGMSGLSEKITLDEIDSNLIVNGSYPKDIVNQIIGYESLLDFGASKLLTVEKYHPTSFNIKLYNSFKNTLSTSELDSLLKCIVVAYKEWFDTHYMRNFTLKSISDIYDSGEYDYSQQMSIIEDKLVAISGYAQEMYSIKPSFTYQGKGFNDIYVRADNIIKNTIDKLDAGITMNALTKDASRLITQYSYQIKLLNNKLVQTKENLANVNKLLDDYDKFEVLYLATSDAITKIDGNSSETYDQLIAARVEISNTITETNSKISQYQLKLEDLKASADKKTTKEQFSLLNSQIAALTQEADELEELLSQMIKAYNTMTFSEESITMTPSIYTAGTFVAWFVSCIKSAGPLCMIVIIAFTAASAVQRNKRKRRSRAAQ